MQVKEDAIWGGNSPGFVFDFVFYVDCDPCVVGGRPVAHAGHSRQALAVRGDGGFRRHLHWLIVSFPMPSIRLGRTD